MKKIAFTLLLVLLSINLLHSNEVTKIGIVDVPKIWGRYAKESAAYRKIVQIEDEYNEELDRRKIIIEELVRERIEAVNDDNEELILQLDSKIAVEKDNLRLYVYYKRKEINNKKATEAAQSEFADLFQTTIKNVAEKNGYSIIMQKNDKDIFWYSPTIDITELVIQELID